MERYGIVLVKWNDGDPNGEQVVYPGTFDELVFCSSSCATATLTSTPTSWPLTPTRHVRWPATCWAVLGWRSQTALAVWLRSGQVGPGRDVWFLFRHEPPPGRCYSDHPPIEGTRVFYLDGGHHTELGADMLVSRDECLRVLRSGLDTGAFPV